jgi:hypothetical protein
MRIYTTVVYDNWLTDPLVPVMAVGFDYCGEIEELKGDQVAQQAESQQANFNAQMQQVFNQQYGKQSAVLDFLTAKLQPMIDNPTGFSREAETAMRTSADDTLSTQYQNAQRALNAQSFAKNGRSLPSGVGTQADAALLQSEAADKANAQNTITVNNENLKNSNLWNAFNVLSGNVTSQFNPLGYAGAADSGANSVANLSNAVTQSKKGFLTSVATSLAGGFGQALGGGGFSGLKRIIRSWQAIRGFIINGRRNYNHSKRHFRNEYRCSLSSSLVSIAASFDLGYSRPSTTTSDWQRTKSSSTVTYAQPSTTANRYAALQANGGQHAQRHVAWLGHGWNSRRDSRSSKSYCNSATGRYREAAVADATAGRWHHTSVLKMHKLPMRLLRRE